MELLLDTDFIIKMSRYALLDAFEALMIANGHAKPFRCLSEIHTLIVNASGHPPSSEFRSAEARNAAWTFASDCRPMDRVEDFDVLREIQEIAGIHSGEAILVEYALRNPNSAIVTSDANFIRAFQARNAQKLKGILGRRILHLDQAVFALGFANQTPDRSEIRSRITAFSDCDASLESVLACEKSPEQAEADLLAATKVRTREGVGTVPAPLCPPFIPVETNIQTS